MNRSIEKLVPVSGRAVGSGLVMLLLLSVLIPSLCVLWFMNQVVKSERSGARQKLTEAYRGQLSNGQEGLQNRLRQISTDLEKLLQTNVPATVFFAVFHSNFADSVICLDRMGKVIYPAPTLPPAPEPFTDEWVQAAQMELSDPAAAATAYGHIASGTTNAAQQLRAIQAQSRSFVRAGKKEEAISLLRRTSENRAFAGVHDSQGRLMIADLELSTLELHGPASHDFKGSILKTLHRQVNDYSTDSMPAAQRRFLMHELRSYYATEIVMPSQDAEDIAIKFLESAPIMNGEAGLMRSSSLPGIWQFRSTNGLLILLHRTEKLEGRMASLMPVQTLPPGVTLSVLAPGKPTEGFLMSVPAGDELPGWRVALKLEDNRFFDAAADKRITTYVWIGLLVLASVLLIAALVLRMVRKQLALTQLRNDLVANVTHELKTPLSSMRLLVETLINTNELNEKTTREYLQLIATENLRLSRLIDNFLTFSRIERNKYSFKFKEQPAGAIAEHAAAVVRDRFDAAGCRFEVQTAPNLPPVVVDDDAIVTVLLNLLDNAFKYSGEQRHVVLRAAAENGSVHFTVTDNGIGLSPRDTKRIFRRFYQVDQRMTRTGGGCGLGLSIVKFIVTAHHGTVEVASEPGKGSAFTVVLPAKTEANHQN